MQQVNLIDRDRQDYLIQRCSVITNRKRGLSNLTVSARHVTGQREKQPKVKHVVCDAQ